MTASAAGDGAGVVSGPFTSTGAGVGDGIGGRVSAAGGKEGSTAVSYTHLTLPTKA